MRERVLRGGSDDEILAWCFEHGKRPTDEQVLIWNKFMLKRGWCDEDDGSTQELERYKASSGLAHRTDPVTFFGRYGAEAVKSPRQFLVQTAAALAASEKRLDREIGWG